MGKFSGADVVSKHKAALARCKGKTGWELLSCIDFRRIPSIGALDEMMKEYIRMVWPFGAQGKTPLGL